ncbi:MAG: hypothetical protein ACE5F9_04235 [Phycisphaerae bacterium]
MKTNSAKHFMRMTAGVMAGLAVWLGANCGFNLFPSPVGGNEAKPGASTTIKLAADFQKDATAGASAASLPCDPLVSVSDFPGLQSGLDCDGNGGAVRYVTPLEFKVALKTLAFVDSNGNAIDIVADTGTLAQAQVLDLTQVVTLPSQSLPAGFYPLYRAEIYYYELTMPLYDANNPKTLRVYASDDDFPAEGSLGHHQGDITLIDSAGAELGFVDAGALWQTAALLQTRGTVNGASGTDSETGHLRGLYGDASLWNDAAQMQGAARDIFLLEGELNLTVGQTNQAITFSFNVKDAWFYEDFDANQLFNPCENGTQDGCGGAWSPVLNPPSVTIQSVVTTMPSTMPAS